MQFVKTDKSTHVTNRQGARFAELARENEVSREDLKSFLEDKQKVKDFFNGMKTGDEWFKKLEVSAKKIGARVYLISKLTVDYTKGHNDAAMAGGPQTQSDYNVLKVADKYGPSEDKVKDETIILFNWPKGGGSYEKAVAWGLENGLRKTTPHVPFAVGEQFPKLNYTLGPNPMYVAETTGCTFDGSASVCYVWWRGANRKSSLGWQSRFGSSDGWFAFRK